MMMMMMMQLFCLLPHNQLITLHAHVSFISSSSSSLSFVVVFVVTVGLSNHITYVFTSKYVKITTGSLMRYK